MENSNSRSSNKKAVLRDRLFVDAEFVTTEMLEAFEIKINVGKDPLSGEDILHTLNHYEQIELTRDQTLYAFNRGDLSKIEKIFHDFEILDERVSEPMQANLKIKFPEGMSWRDYQPDAIDTISSLDYGILQAPPRSGKTLMLCASVCMERQKTLIFAHQTDLLEQMFETFEKFTNLKDIRTGGNPVVGFAKSIDDFDRLDVALCTKQTFDNSKNFSKMKVVQKMFGYLIVDEAHFVGAEIYSKLINRFWAKKRQGCSATPKRKDQLDVVIDGVLGPPVHIITPEQTKQVPMKVKIHNTGVNLKAGMWPRYLTDLSKIESRNNLITHWVHHDVQNGHTVIVVTDRKDHAKTLQLLLKEKGIVSTLFTGDLTSRDRRLAVLNSVRSGEIKVLIAMRSMTTGLDIPIASHFHNTLPSANAVSGGEYEGSGGYEQQCTRVLTDFPGKVEGVVRDYQDFSPIAFGCMKQREKTYAKLKAEVTKEKAVTKEIKREDSQDSTTF